MDNESLLEQYIQNLDSLFDNIVEDIRSPSFSVSDKYKTKQEELENILFKECGGDKFEFINRIKHIAHDA